MAKSYRISNEEHIRRLEEQLNKRTELENLKKKQLDRLEKEKNLSAYKKAIGGFSLPFKKKAFESLVEAMLFLLFTFVFSGCTFFVLIAILFCAVVDAVYSVLFGIAYPFLVIYIALFKKQRIKVCELKLDKTKKKLYRIPSYEKINNKIKEYEREIRREKRKASSTRNDRPIIITDNVKNTDYYKEKTDEYYRIYMGFPPKEESSLSSLATDTSLDIDVGDY